jgi:hypothetical protein
VFAIMFVCVCVYVCDCDCGCVLTCNLCSYFVTGQRRTVDPRDPVLAQNGFHRPVDCLGETWLAQGQRHRLLLMIGLRGIG